ncbi:uncharacterized protein LOC129595337 [Paramacrobiotus metropolitanus]|uniref:uncharacterized protein LOC129595337 n=1 Tax=Paramacrobiotus metropolitanus TaxID=2943436 RepID=UPI00244599B2|nr:uncharacterized protein LOC129595337 [Paramacrobiotus metropolitanus]
MDRKQLCTRKYASLLEDKMECYEMYLRRDSVDVWDTSGHLHYGRVVDVADNGLFIDFLCPDRRRELTPFHRVFKMLAPLHEWRDWRPYKPQSVEVLLRPSPRGPWTWMPAHLSLKQRQECDWPGEVGVVHLLTAESVAEGPLHVVPPQRLRQPFCDLVSASGPRSDAELRAYYGHEFKSCVIHPGTFFKGQVRLTAQLALLSEEMQRHLLDEWRDKALVPDCSIDHPLIPFEFVQRMDDGCTWTYIERTDRRQARFYQFASRLGKALPGMIYKTLRLATDTDPANDESLMWLPVELLLEVFSHMDTMQQTRMHRVCSSWAVILQSPVLTSFLIIPRPSENRADYPLTACLVHLLNSSIQRIMILGGDKNRVKEASHVMRFLAYRCGALRLKAISFVRPGYTLLLDPYRYGIRWLGAGPSEVQRWEMKIPKRLTLARSDRVAGSGGDVADVATDLWNLVKMHTVCSEGCDDREKGCASLARIQTEWQRLQNIDPLCETILELASDPDCRDALGDLQLGNYSSFLMCKLVEFVDILQYAETGSDG